MLIDLQYLLEKYNFNIKGVIHIGASKGQEMPAYRAAGDFPVVWIEALPHVFRELEREMRNYTNVDCLHALITDIDGEQLDFHVSNNEGQSSSIFEFGTHTIEHPGVVFLNKIRLASTTIKTLFESKGINPAIYDFVNIDIQGAELKALKSMDLSLINYAYVEVNEKPLYFQCPLLPEIDEYMSDKGFTRVELKMTSHGWGDAFYMRVFKKKLPVKVPAQFQPHPPSTYPSDNYIDFEHWYFANYSPHEGRIYLPIMWTAYYCKHKYGKDATAIQGLQNYLDLLDPNQKYYTIVQYDDGILNDLSKLDILVYSMSGKPMDYPLPLICSPHFALKERERVFTASFIGRITHPIRERLNQFRNLGGWLIADRSLPMARYCDLLNTSVFTLCPRGYGPTSFRITEALQFGSIPVYISDEFIEPHNVPFETYGVLIRPNQIDSLPEILSKVDVKFLQESGRIAYESWFTYQSNKEIIDHHSSIS